MKLDNNWFTEISSESGSAFSLKVAKKLHEEQTPYQRIEIYKTEKFGNLMVIDGFVMLSQRDNFIYHEMLAHPVLYTHISPEKVLIIGGGDCGTLKETLKHQSVAEVWQVEIDERVTRLAEKYFSDLCRSNQDPRANFHFGDGIQWVTETADETYDVIIIDSTDPVGPATGLFTESFYRDCYRILRNHGILVQQSESPLIHLDIIKAMQKAMKTAGFSEIQLLNFPQCVYPSGWWSATMAGKSTPLTKFREHSIEDMASETKYYNPGIHHAAMSYPEFLRKELC